MHERELAIRRLVDGVVDLTFAYDLDAGALLFVGGRTEEICGWMPAALEEAFARGELEVARSYFARVLPDRIAAWRRGERTAYSDEIVLPHRTGGTVWLDCRSRIVVDDVTGHLLACAVCHPIELRQREPGARLELLEDLERIAKIGAWSFDPATGRGQWSREVAAIHEVPLSYEPSAERGLAFYEPASRVVLEAALARALADGTPYDLELEITSAAGQQKWVRTIALPVVMHGKVVRMRGTIQDISDRKRAELAIAEERARLQTIFDTIPDLLFVKDLEGRFVAANEHVARLLGSPRDALIGKTDHDFLSPEAAEFFRERDRIALERGVPTKNEEVLTYPNGEQALVEMSKTPLRDAEGRIVGVIGVGRDITAARDTEQQLRVAQKMEAIGRLAGGIAHDFNNLLTVILTCADSALDQLETEGSPLKDDLAQILGAGRRAGNLTRQLLAFSRRQVLKPELLRLDVVVEHVGGMLRRLIGEDIDLRIRADEVAPTTLDRGQIEQVLLNLVVNARDAMPEGGILTVTTRNVVLDDATARELELAAGAYVELAVEDSGIGMDAATLARIFEPFFTTKEPGRGTGLGLSTVYGIVKQSGGAIRVRSTPGRGTRFALHFRKEAGRPTGASAAPLTGGEHALQPRRHATILVVEDDPLLRNVIDRILVRAGYRVTAAATAEEALGHAAQLGEQLDLVLSDVVMPKMSGNALVEQLAERLPHLKVILTSGYTDDENARRDIGQHPFLAKPFRADQLMSIVREVLEAT